MKLVQFTSVVSDDVALEIEKFLEGKGTLKVDKIPNKIEEAKVFKNLEYSKLKELTEWERGSVSHKMERVACGEFGYLIDIPLASSIISYINNVK